MNTTPHLPTVEDWGSYARDILPRPLFDGLFGPVHQTNTNNELAFQKLRIKPRVLAGVNDPQLRTSALGTTIEMPVIVAPTGNNQRFHPDGEITLARGAHSVGTISTVGVVANYSLEEVAEATDGPLWYQHYFFTDRALNEVMVQRAEAAGYKALVLTVDVSTTSPHDADYFRSLDGRIWGIEPGRLLKNFHGLDVAGHASTVTEMTSCVSLWKRDVTWEDVAWLRSFTRLPIVIKGVQTAEDARLSVEHEASGVVVSNHGGHAMNGARATIDALCEVVAAVGDEIEVLLDGGVRAGADVLKALALGARAVMVGRAAIWGLSCGGELGVNSTLSILRDELEDAMGHCGLAEICAADASLVDAGGGEA